MQNNLLFVLSDTSRQMKYTQNFTMQIEQVSLSLVLFNIQFVCSLLIQGEKETESDIKKIG